MAQTDEEQLHAAIWALHDALQRRDGLEERLRAGELDEELYDRSLSASETVVHARLSLYRLLVAQGWTPPRSVTSQLPVDAELTRVSGGHLL